MCALSQVSKLLPTGSAAESGMVKEGDLLRAVDGVDVRLWPLKKLANEKVLPFRPVSTTTQSLTRRRTRALSACQTGAFSTHQAEHIPLLIPAWLTGAPVRAQILGRPGTEVVLTLESPSGAVKDVKLVRR